jgi:hypothetical protein
MDMLRRKKMSEEIDFEETRTEYIKKDTDRIYNEIAEHLSQKYGKLLVLPIKRK